MIRTLVQLGGGVPPKARHVCRKAGHVLFGAASPSFAHDRVKMKRVTRSSFACHGTVAFNVNAVISCRVSAISPGPTPSGGFPSTLRNSATTSYNTSCVNGGSTATTSSASRSRSSCPGSSSTSSNYAITRRTSPAALAFIRGTPSITTTSGARIS